MAIKQIVQLNTATTPSNNDLFIVQNAGTSATMNISFADIAKYLNDTDKTGGWQLLDCFQGNATYGQIATSTYQGNHCMTGRAYHKATFDTDEVSLLVANLIGGVSDANGMQLLNPPLCSITYRICIQLKGATVDDQTGQRYPITYQGSEQITVRPNEIIKTDPCPIALAAGQVYYVIASVESSCQGYPYVPTSYASCGGTQSGGLNNGEGTSSGDLSLVGTFTPSYSYQAIPHFVAVLGYTKIPQRSVITYGTSIEDGTGDSGAGPSMWPGAMHRALAGVAVHTVTPTIYAAANSIPFFRAVEGGKNGLQTLTFMRSSPVWQLENYVSTVLWGHCNNDTPTFANLKALCLQAADLTKKGGNKFIACTNVVQSGATSDNWQTLANYSPGGNGYAINAYAAWLRDASPSGFQAAAGGAEWADYWDVCVGEECNGLGEPVLSGGYRCPPSEPSIYTGTVTNAFTPWIFGDSHPTNLPSAQDALLGYRVMFDTGAAAGSSFPVAQNLPYRVQAAAGNMVSPTIPVWVINHAYNLRDVVKNGSNYYTCTQAGNSAGAGGPTGSGIVDNTCQWEYMAPSANWAPTTGYTVGTFVIAGGARLYYCTAAGTSSGTAPTSTTITTPITDGTVTWEYFGVLQGAWTGNQAYTQNQGNLALAYKYWTNAGNIYRLTQNGTTAPTGGPTGTGIVDNTCTWNLLQCGAAGVQRGDTYHIGTFTSLDGSHLGTEGYMHGANAFLNNAWQPSTQYMMGMDVVSNGHRYRCTNAGPKHTFASSGTVAPTGTTYGVDIIDGGVTWRFWDTQLGSLPWFIGQTWVQGHVIQANGNCYKCVLGGAGSGSGSHGPSGTGTNIVDNAARWDWLNAGHIPTWIQSGVYREGQIVSNGGNLYFCQIAGAGAVAGAGPTGTGTSITDNAVTWSYYIPHPIMNNGQSWLNKIA